MAQSIYQRIDPPVSTNERLRLPQKECYERIRQHYASPNADREVGVVLPVGCGKSGIIALAPFALRARRALVIAPNLNITTQLFKDADPASEKFFLKKRGVLLGEDFPEPALLERGLVNREDLEAAEVVITNIQQLQGSDNRWLDSLPGDFFDAILVDEAHHNVADSWAQVRAKFPDARIINFSATPSRADGRLMTGKIIYSFSVSQAMELGFVKRLRAVVLNPKSLSFVRRDGEVETTVDLEEVRRLGSEDAGFRRSIVTSSKTLHSIVERSIIELQQQRSRTGEGRLKIIASALNFEHCIQIRTAFQERGLRAEYVHSKEDTPKNQRVFDRLERHELDVIVQVRQLGEGFDHPFLSVAAVCSVFAHLGPFVQFVGRVMRTIDGHPSDSPVNQGIVVFHAGANIAPRWEDFQSFTEADKDYFDQLLSTQYVEPDDSSAEERAMLPTRTDLEIRAQDHVTAEVIPLWKRDDKARDAVDYLIAAGFTADEFAAAQAVFTASRPTKQRVRQASRSELDSLTKTKVVATLRQRKVNPEGRGVDPKRPELSAFVVTKSKVDTKVAELVGRPPKSRQDWSQDELDRALESLDSIIASVCKEIFDGAS
jgi:superfamily II DNA or RNA helicase